MQGKRLVAILASAGAALLWASQACASEIQWVTSYGDAKKTARQRDTLMMIDFHADW